MYKVHRASSIPAQTPLGGGARIPPNATKVFYRWGMEKRLREVAVRSQGILFAQCESSHYSIRSPPPHVRPDDSGSVVGSHQWEEEVLEETGGDFLLIHVRHLAHPHTPPNPRFSSHTQIHTHTICSLRTNVQYADLRRILAESAREHGANLRTKCMVIDIHPDAERPYLTLANGEVMTADVIIGADGCHMPHYHVRRAILKALRQPDTEVPMGMQLFK